MVFIGDLIHFLLDDLHQVAILRQLCLRSVLQLGNYAVAARLDWTDGRFLHRYSDTWKCKSGSFPDLIFERDFFMLSVTLLSRRGSLTWLKWL
jgi:hypothetical protein